MTKSLEQADYKGVILAGGLGTRLNPLTLVTNKHLLPVYDKPLIYYSLSTLLSCKIRNILIISNPKEIKYFKKLFGDGSRLGIKIKYLTQKKPRGIPEAFLIGEKFLKNSKVALILGDNFFYGEKIHQTFTQAINKNTHCTIFSYKVPNPNAYGVIEIEKKKIISLKEKPKKTHSKLAITGLYFFNNDVVKFAKKLKPSSRKELEIIDILLKYKNMDKLSVVHLGKKNVWFDAGTFENIHKASKFVKNFQNIKKIKIGCPENIMSKKS